MRPTVDDPHAISPERARAATDALARGPLRAARGGEALATVTAAAAARLWRPARPLAVGVEPGAWSTAAWNTRGLALRDGWPAGGGVRAGARGLARLARSLFDPARSAARGGQPPGLDAESLRARLHAIDAAAPSPTSGAVVSRASAAWVAGREGLGRRSALGAVALAPRRAYFWWELAPSALAGARGRPGAETGLVLRFYDYSGLDPAAGVWRQRFDVAVAAGAAGHYVDFWRAERRYRVELLRVAADGRVDHLADGGFFELPPEDASPDHHAAALFLAENRVLPPNPDGAAFEAEPWARLAEMEVAVQDFPDRDLAAERRVRALYARFAQDGARALRDAALPAYRSPVERAREFERRRRREALRARSRGPAADARTTVAKAALPRWMLAPLGPAPAGASLLPPWTRGPSRDAAPRTADGDAPAGTEELMASSLRGLMPSTRSRSAVFALMAESAACGRPEWLPDWLDVSGVLGWRRWKTASSALCGGLAGAAAFLPRAYAPAVMLGREAGACEPDYRDGECIRRLAKAGAAVDGGIDAAAVVAEIVADEGGKVDEDENASRDTVDVSDLPSVTESGPSSLTIEAVAESESKREAELELELAATARAAFGARPRGRVLRVLDGGRAKTGAGAAGDCVTSGAARPDVAEAFAEGGAPVLILHGRVAPGSRARFAGSRVPTESDGRFALPCARLGGRWLVLPGLARARKK